MANNSDFSISPYISFPSQLDPFEVKKTTMPESAKKNFIHRKPTFFKANSKVDPATGFDVSSMKSTVGFVKIAGKGNTVEDLEEQEGGGDIGGRSFIPLKQARTGNSWNKTVRAKARISDIKSKIVDSRRAKGKTDEEKFIKSAIHAGVNGWVLGNRENGRGNKLLWSVSIDINGCHYGTSSKTISKEMEVEPPPVDGKFVPSCLAKFK